MRLLIVNPNTSLGVTKQIDAAAQSVTRPGEHITTLCPTHGPELIVTPEDAATAKQAVLDTVRENVREFDGVILASFGNTGAAEVRDWRPDLPVLGIAEAAFAAARKYGGPFGIVTFGRALVPGLRAEVEKEELSSNLIGISHLQAADFGDPATVQTRHLPELAALCQQMEHRGATSIVMGGGPLAGLADGLSGNTTIPLIDGTQAAVALMRERLNERCESATRPDGFPVRT